MSSNQTFPSSSTKSALGKVTCDFIAESNGQILALISFDFSAAYDTLGHSLLLEIFLHLDSRAACTFHFPLISLLILSWLVLLHFPNILMSACPGGLLLTLFSSYPHYVGDHTHFHDFKFYPCVNTQFCNASSTHCLELSLYIICVCVCVFLIPSTYLTSPTQYVQTELFIIYNCCPTDISSSVAQNKIFASLLPLTPLTIC